MHASQRTSPERGLHADSQVTLHSSNIATFSSPPVGPSSPSTERRFQSRCSHCHINESSCSAGSGAQSACCVMARLARVVWIFVVEPWSRGLDFRRAVLGWIGEVLRRNFPLFSVGIFNDHLVEFRCAVRARVRLKFKGLPASSVFVLVSLAQAPF